MIITATEDDFVPLAVDYFLKYCVKTNPETGLILETGKFVMTDQCNVVICGEKSDLSSITSDHNYATLSEKVGKITKSGNFDIMQGGYINENYAWIAMINTADYDTKAAGVYIYKYDVKTWRMVKRSQILMLDHANDITYDPATNELYVVHCYVDSKKVTVIDADSLEVKRDMHVTGGYGIYSLTYNPERKQFVGGTGKTNMVFFNDKLAFTGYRPGVSTQLITQGITSDSRYVYHVLFTTQSVEPYNMIFVYDIEKGKLQNKIRLSISGQEPENISIVNGEFMIGCNSSSASYADVFHSILIDFGVW